MSWQAPGHAPPPQHYSPDGLWYWDGARWLPVPDGRPSPDQPGPWQRGGGIGSRAWAPRPPAPPSGARRQPLPPPLPPAAVDIAPAGMYRARRRRSYLVDVAIVLVALVVLGGIGSGAVIAIRNHQTAVPSSAPGAQIAGARPQSLNV